MGSPSTALISAKDSASGVLKGVTDTIRDGLNTVAAAAVKATQGLSAISTVISPILGVVRILASTVAAVFVAFSALASIVNSTLQIIRSLFAILATLFNVLKAIMQTVLTVIKAVAGAIMAVFNSISNAVGKLAGGINSHLGTILKVALGVTAAIGAAFIAAALAAEKAWTPLAQTLGRMSIAGVSEKAIAGVREFAKEVRRATTMASADVVDLAEKAARLRIPEDQLKAVTGAAVGLASALNISTSEAMGKLADALRGDYDGFKNLIPQLKGVTDDTARLAIVMGIAQQGIDLAAKKASTFGGLWQSFKNVLAENSALLGEKIAPGIAKIVDALRPLLGLLESTGDGFAKVFNGMADIIAPIITKLVGWFAVAYAAFFAFGQTVTANWTTTWELIKVSFEYYVLAISGTVKHFFTVQLPAYFNWFREFATSWLTALQGGFKTGFSALFQNIAQVAAVGWQAFKTPFANTMSFLLNKSGETILALGTSWAEWLANPAGAAAKSLAGGLSGMAADSFGEFIDKGMNPKSLGQRIKDAWTESLTSGFGGADTPTLPDVAGRQITDAEKDLGDRMRDLGAELGKEFNGNFERNMAGFNAILSGAPKDKVKGEIGGLKSLGAEAGSGGGNNLLESRFLTRAPGNLSVEAQILTNVHNEQRTQSAAMAKQAQAAADMQKSMQAIQTKLLGIKFEGIN